MSRRRVDVGGVRRAVAGGDDVHRLARLRQRDARPQPRDGLKEEAAAVQLRRRQERHFGGPRHPDLQLIQRERRCGLGQDADDGVRRAVERERLAEHRRIAVEALLPHRMADQHDVLAAGRIFVRREIAADHRLQAQRRQQRRRGLEANELFRIAAAGQRERVADRQREIAEHLLPLLHFEEARIGEADAREVLRLVRRAQSDQPVRLAIRQRTQEDRVDDAEERDVRADAEREAEDGDQREAGRLEQLTDRVTDLGHAASVTRVYRAVRCAWSRAEVDLIEARD